MGLDALPCIICRVPLRNADPNHAENQPYQGTRFESHGHYGSTAWDPFDWSYIEINLCDPCLQAAGRDGVVLMGRIARPVEVDGLGVVGRERVERPKIGWKPEFRSYDEDDVVHLGLDEVERYIDNERITWNFDRDLLLRVVKEEFKRMERDEQ